MHQIIHYFSNTDNIIKYAPIVISIIAIKPWLLFSWLRKILFTRIVFDESNGNIEIGFSNYGSTVALSGKLLSLSNDLSISNITLSVLRNKDLSKHIFKCSFSREFSYDSHEGSNVVVTPIKSIKLSPSSPENISLFFINNTTYADVQSTISSVTTSWTEHIKSNLTIDTKITFDQALATLRQQYQTYDKYNEFLSFDWWFNAYNMLNLLMFWQEGLFIFEVDMKIHNSKKHFTKKWIVEITPKDEITFRNNVYQVLNMAGNWPHTFEFVYKAYSEIPPTK